MNSVWFNIAEMKKRARKTALTGTSGIGVGSVPRFCIVGAYGGLIFSITVRMMFQTIARKSLPLLSPWEYSL